jgi:hypothetical protein
LLKSFQRCPLDNIILSSITLVGIVITFVITRQNNKNQILSLVSEFKNDYKKVVFCIKDANNEIDELLKELNGLKGEPKDFVAETIPKILYDKEKYSMRDMKEKEDH